MAENSGSGNPDNPNGGNEPTKFTMDEFKEGKWRDALSEEYGTHASMSNFKTIDDFGKSYIHAQKMVGTDKIPIPGEDDADGWAQVYDKLGRPSDLDGYEFNLPEGAPDNWSGDAFKEYQTNFKQNVHDLGLSKRQAEKVWEFVQNQAMDNYNNSVQQRNDFVNKLAEKTKTEFGADLMNHINQRDALLRKFGGEDAVEYVKKNPALNNSPVMLKMFSEMAKNFKEDVITDALLPKGDTMTPNEAKSKVNAILSDKNHPYLDSSHPNHSEAVEEFMKLVSFSKGKKP